MEEYDQLTVQGLMDKLKRLPPDALIISQWDSEPRGEVWGVCHCTGGGYGDDYEESVVLMSEHICSNCKKQRFNLVEGD